MECHYNKTHARKHGIPMLSQNSINLTCYNFCSYGKYLIQVQVKLSLCMPQRHNWGERTQSTTHFFNFVTRCRWIVRFNIRESATGACWKVPWSVQRPGLAWTLVRNIDSFSFLQPICSVTILTTQLLGNLWWAGKKMFEIQTLIPKIQRPCSVNP